MGGRQHYQKAISILVKALRFSGEEPEHDEFLCTCHYCSMDGCIVSNDEDYTDNTPDMNEDNADGSTIDENPMYVYEGHHMGSTLTYIIAFNLAIAHHLPAMERPTMNRRMLTWSNKRRLLSTKPYNSMNWRTTAI